MLGNETPLLGCEIGQLWEPSTPKDKKYSMLIYIVVLGHTQNDAICLVQVQTQSECFVARVTRTGPNHSLR